LRVGLDSLDAVTTPNGTFDHKKMVGARPEGLINDED